MTGDPLPRSPELLERLMAMQIEEPGSARSFEQALAEEQGWSAARAEEVGREYRRFLYLAATAGGEVTPSAAVDMAWHLHLTYTRHYWETLCGEIIGGPLHHRPSPGGTGDDALFQRQYDDTLALYEASFGAPPPPAVWPRRRAPAHARRPAAAPDQGSNKIPWPAWAAGGVVISLCAALAGGPLAGLAAAAVMLVVFVVARAVAAETRGRPGRRSAAGNDAGCGGVYDAGDGDGGGCGGGCGGS